MPPNLATLPLEVRNIIYSHVFDYNSIEPWVSDESCKRLLIYSLTPEQHRHSKGFHKGSDPQEILALLSVNHQISDEAAPYFYAKTSLCGRWYQIAPFIKGIGAHRRDMIRTVKINHPYRLTTYQVEAFDLLTQLPNLRTLRIAACMGNFTHLQNELIQGGILRLAGKCDINVRNSYIHLGLRHCVQDNYEWSCARDTTQWIGGELSRMKPQTRASDLLWQQVD